MHLLKKGHTRALDPVVGSDSGQQSHGEKKPVDEANIDDVEITHILIRAK
jgi:hypothetical protein